jgi:hypothetical protein
MLANKLLHALFWGLLDPPTLELENRIFPPLLKNHRALSAVGKETVTIEVTLVFQPVNLDWLSADSITNCPDPIWNLLVLEVSA